MEFYVIRDKVSGKFADGYYGWDASIHSDCQVFGEGEIPFNPSDDLDFVVVACGEYKPSSAHVNHRLQQLGLIEVRPDV